MRNLNEITRVLALGAAISGAGCADLTSARCGPERRNTDASGIVTQNGLVVLKANVFVSEFREGAGSITMSFIIESATLKGDITAVSLVRATDPETVVLTLTLFPSPPTHPIVVSQQFHETVGARSPQLAGMFDLLRANKLMLRLTTQAAPDDPLLLPLVVGNQSDWDFGYCST